MHAALEVAIAAEDAAHHQLVLGDGLGNLRREWTAVADACRAAVTDEEEAKLFKRPHQAGVDEVIGDRLGAGSEARFDPRLRFEAALGRFLRDEAGGDEDGWVRRVCATGDGGDDDGAVSRWQLAAGSWQRSSRTRLSQFCFRCRLRVLFLDLQIGERVEERFFDVLQGDAILRPTRSSERRLDLAEIEFRRVRVDRIGRTSGAEQTLFLGVCLDALDVRRRTARESQVDQRLLVDREDAARRAVFGRHVRNGGAIGERHRVEAGAEELDKLADDAFIAQHLRYGQNEVGCGRPFGKLAGELEADHLWNEHRHRLAEHGRLRFDAADAPAEHAQAVDHRRVRIGADQRVGVQRVRFFIVKDDAREILQIHLVHDPGLRRHDLEVAKGALPPAQEDVAFLVALILDVRVEAERVRGAEVIDLHGVIDHEFRWLQRIDLGRIAAHALHGVAHRRQIDDARHAGEVLQKDARDRECDLLVRLRLRVPLRERGNVVGTNVEAVLGAEQILKQNLE